MHFSAVWHGAGYLQVWWRKREGESESENEEPEEPEGNEGEDEEEEDDSDASDIGVTQKTPAKGMKWSNNPYQAEATDEWKVAPGIARRLYEQPAPSTYMTLMYNLHYTLSTTTYDAPTDHWVVHGTDSLLPADYTPPTHNPGPDTYARGDDLDDPHIWGTWEPKSLDTVLSIRSGYKGLGRAMYCLAKWTQRTWRIPTDRWVWVVTLRPQQREAPPNRRGPTTPRPTTLQLCPYMVAARLMTLLWPRFHTPTQSYPHLTEEDMPGIQRCFFQTLDYLQQTHPHVLEQIWPPPG